MKKFSSIAKNLTENEDQIVLELNNCQGISQEISGYYMPKESALYNAMRPSFTLNTIIDNFSLFKKLIIKRNKIFFFCCSCKCGI